MDKTFTVGLVSHIIKDDNLGCGALAISNIKLLDEVFKQCKIKVKYIIATLDYLEQVSLDAYTDNDFEYRVYPRCSQTLRNPLKLLTTKVFNDCDIVFNLCGGDGYADIYGVKRLLAESQLTWIASMKGVPMIFSPQTIGPFETKFGKIISKTTLNKVSHIYVRDKMSFDCTKKLGFRDKVSEVIDVAFALPYKEVKMDNQKFNIGINVSGLLYNGGYNRDNYFNLSFSYKEFIHKLLKQLMANDSYRVHLVSHVISNNDIEDDYRICKLLSEQYNCILAPKFNSPIEAKSYIAGLDFFSGARMHSTIAAISSATPVIPIAYSRKFNGLYGNLDYSWIIDAKSDLDVNTAIEIFFDYMNDLEEMKRSIKHSSIIFNESLNKYKEDLKNRLMIILNQK